MQVSADCSFVLVNGHKYHNERDEERPLFIINETDFRTLNKADLPFCAEFKPLKGKFITNYSFEREKDSDDLSIVYEDMHCWKYWRKRTSIPKWFEAKQKVLKELRHTVHDYHDDGDFYFLIYSVVAEDHSLSDAWDRAESIEQKLDKLTQTKIREMNKLRRLL